MGKFISSNKKKDMYFRAFYLTMQHLYVVVEEGIMLVQAFDIIWKKWRDTEGKSVSSKK